MRDRIAILCDAMGRKGIWLLAALVVMMWVGERAMGAESIALVKAGQGRATVVIGSEASVAEKHAAEEFVKYIKQMSGAELTIEMVGAGSEVAGKGAVVAIGTKEGNSLIADLISRQRVTDPATLSGYDGYVIETVREGERDVVVLAGSTKASVPYPVYQLLENEFGCGYFQDGDFVPRKQTLVVSPQKVAESSRFKERHGVAPNTCGGWYSIGQLYDIEDWKRQIDWMVKHRLNYSAISNDGEGILIKQRTSQRLRGQEPLYDVAKELPNKEAPYYARQVELHIQVVNYMRELGMLPIIWVEQGMDFKAELTVNHPDTGGADSVHNFYLSNPAYKKWIKLFIEEYTKEFGTDHYYGGVGEPYSEAQFPDGEVYDDMLAAAARCPVSGVKAADPEGIASITGWPFLYWGNNKARMQGYMANIGSDDFRVWDMGWAGTETGNYYWGRPWVVGSVLFFGGDYTFFGDYAGHQKYVQNLLADPRSESCVGILYNSELIDYNPQVWEFVGRSSWNADVDVEAYQKHYARIRYGSDICDVMEKVVRGIYESCYQSDEWLVRWPVYSLHQRLDPRERRGDNPAGALKQIVGVEKAMEMMLSVADHEVAKRNALFGRDLVDLARQEITILFGQGMVQMSKAYDAGDAQAIRAVGEDLLWLLKRQETLASSRPEYRIEWWADHFAQKPQEHDSIAAAMRNYCFTHVDLGPLDYPRKDMYELIKYYYYPRFEWYVNELASCVEEKREYPEVESLHYTVFAEMVKKWKQEGYDKNDAVAYDGSMIDAVREVFSELRSRDAYQNIVGAMLADPRIEAEGTAAEEREGIYRGHFEKRKAE
jgi:alpha-N-acetylglucosaminidase